MEDAISSFFNMVYEEFIAPLILAFDTFINDNSLMLGNFFDTFLNWLFNIGRETPFNYFQKGESISFLEDLLLYILLFIAIFLIIKVIKIIFKPIFKLFNIGGDIKWRR